MSKHLSRTSEVLTSFSFVVTRTDISKIRQVLSVEHFWSLNNHQQSVTTDGTELLLEVRDGDKYHVVYAGSTLDGPILRIAEVVAGIAHVHLVGG
jgi:hypothetical protein